MNYDEFIASKQFRRAAYGKLIEIEDIHSLLFPFQKDVTAWAVRKGRCAIFLDTGLGKTLCQLEWARLLNEKTLIVAPLSVGRQTVREGQKIDLAVQYVRSQREINDSARIWITNYEMIDHFDFLQFGAIVLDESSILKSISGHTKRKLIKLCANVPYRLCCTATPAPNDHIELGNHAEFLGICSRSEMLAQFFVNANKEHTFHINGTAYRKKGTNKAGTEWRLKHHAENPFFRWLSSWAIMMIKPSDLGYDDGGFILPPLNIHTHFVESDYQPDDRLFFTHIKGVREQARIRRHTIPQRLKVLRRLVNNQDMWYNLGHEQKRIYEEVGGNTSGAYPGISGENEEQAKCASPGIVRSGRMAQDCCPKTGARMGGGEPREKESSENKGLWDHASRIHGTNEKAEQCLRNLQLLQSGRSELFPAGRSLSQNGPSEGIALHELQSSPGQVSGQFETDEGSNKLSGKQWVVWCGLNEEQDAIAEMFGDEGISIHGSLPTEEKIRRLDLWLDKKKSILISKPRVLGYGLNLQQAHEMIFFGLNYSWEQYYQCIRREWRYLQEHPVNVHIILADIEDGIYHNIMRKDAQAKRLREQMIKQLEGFEKEELGMVAPLQAEYEEDKIVTEHWTAMLGDSSERLVEIGDDSIDLSIYSPPFADLYTYTPSPRDLGNSRNWDEFFEHYAYIIREVLRVTKPGRVTCVHTSDIPALAQKDGYIGIKDFPGRVIAAYEAEGWIFHGRIVISKNPQAQAIRTHSKGLLFVQLKKDSVHSRPALLDQVLVFRKPGDNQVPITPVANREMNNDLWIKWACGIWHDINETNVLRHGYKHGRAHDDEKHICPLQLETIERCIKLYSNPGEVVLSPFGGIGSEGYVAVKHGRRAILIELKKSYFDEMVRNLQIAASEKIPTLFEFAGVGI